MEKNEKCCDYDFKKWQTWCVLIIIAVISFYIGTLLV